MYVCVYRVKLRCVHTSTVKSLARSSDVPIMACAPVFRVITKAVSTSTPVKSSYSYR